MPSIKTHQICNDCYEETFVSSPEVEEGQVLTETSSEYAYCGMCHSYKNRNFTQYHRIVVKIGHVHIEECDCMESHGRIMHNDGGNYHHNTLELARIYNIT